MFDHSQAIPSPQEIVGFAAHHVSSRLTRLLCESGALTFDPAKLPRNGNADGVIRDGQWRGHAHTTVRRVHTEVQVLDGLADDLNGQAADHDLAALSIHAGS
jgi:hypothetical protein